MPNRYILLVEDNPNDELLTRRAFAQSKMSEQLVVAHDGAEAIDFLLGTGVHAGRDARQTPSLILMDLKLPKLDGLEVLKRLRANEVTRDLPVIVLSTSDEEENVRESFQLGVNGYLRKPVDFKEFVRAIRELGLFWLKLNDKVS